MKPYQHDSERKSEATTNEDNIILLSYVVFIYTIFRSNWTIFYSN